MTGRLEGKVALITGAGMGMGREACVVFSSEHAGIVALDIEPVALEETARLVRDAGGKIVTFATDVADERGVSSAVQGAFEAFGALNILYNNAGVLWRDRDLGVLDIDEQVWDRVMAINLKGMVWVCKYGIPRLIEGGAARSLTLVQPRHCSATSSRRTPIPRAKELWHRSLARWQSSSALAAYAPTASTQASSTHPCKRSARQIVVGLLRRLRQSPWDDWADPAMWSQPLFSSRATMPPIFPAPSS
jgi:NAD(P)-dependent dehydrogenase (short-subunit alcohol dehydrogenase family)